MSATDDQNSTDKFPGYELRCDRGGSQRGPTIDPAHEAGENVRAASGEQAAFGEESR